MGWMGIPLEAETAVAADITEALEVSLATKRASEVILIPWNLLGPSSVVAVPDRREYPHD